MGSVGSCSTPGFQSEILSRRGRKLAVCVKRNNYSGCIVGRAIGLMPLIFPEHGVLHELCGGPPGACPLGHGTPSSRSSLEESSPSTTQQAGQGAGGPKGHPRGRPPH